MEREKLLALLFKLLSAADNAEASLRRLRNEIEKVLEKLRNGQER